MSIRRILVGLAVFVTASTPLFAQTPEIEFFEAKIRPVLVQKCYGCHNSKMAAPKGNLVLDTKEGLLKGGVSGPVIVPGKPAESRLITALSYTDPLAQMPPERQTARRRPCRFPAVDCARRRRSARERPRRCGGGTPIQRHVARRGPQVVGVPTGGRPCGAEAGVSGWLAEKQDRQLRPREAAGEKARAFAAGRPPHAGYARVR